MQPVHVFFRHPAFDLPRAGDVEGLPTQGALLAQNRGAAEGVAGMQWDGMVEDVEDAHGYEMFGVGCVGVKDKSPL